MTQRPVAGVDGCKAGWIAVIALPGEALRAQVFGGFAELVASLPPDALVAVDMPIGLPAFSGPGGRGPEAAVRPLLGRMKRSVFSIPSRAAVYAEPGRFDSPYERSAGHQRACLIARATSTPPRAVSIQAFCIFKKICQIDTLLRERPDLRDRILESHPEVAFWRLNGDTAMLRSKKTGAGMEERQALLARCGVDRGFLHQPPPRGAAADDFLDAAVMMLVAARHARGETQSFPDLPGRDEHGIPIAIWA